uniref:GTP 3',8-cyclase n=1 Tax=Candidatus Kentrum sp. TUN TaxID=2126343 RepID=A0A450ZRL5_9GAMM|nr:MAG: cyclic pyranopterin monophosphate synthase subunit MoaA [Candidatus Kentron sp. TUN]VFK58869.1 MAG: cyclic pyranopterin monophosphate synthase subunit MoaA [Candidatus Kentron sp. TUN]VFK62709.1 MAG: cyclic pyranopterin monophosphate synthase subunit MoaA [Candidatus Kentron sp. TUN]
MSKTPQLIDPFGRRIEYVRLSVTDNCNYRCFYCLPSGSRSFAPSADWLRFDEIERIVRLFSELGVNRFRITGGEPLVRKGIVDLATRISALPGVHDLSLSTNASLLAKYATSLYQAGVGRINVSLDTLKPDRFRTVTGGSGHLKNVLAGLAAAKTAGFSPIKINMVALKGQNDDEFEDMVAFCLANHFMLRFIEAMPMGCSSSGTKDHYLDLSEVKKQLEKRFKLIPDVTIGVGAGPARYFKIPGTKLRIGFITPLSQHFCETCNRVRLSANGILYLCLGQNRYYDLRPLLRGGTDDDGLRSAIIDALALKPERHEFMEKPEQVNRFMSITGG